MLTLQGRLAVLKAFLIIILAVCEQPELHAQWLRASSQYFDIVTNGSASEGRSITRNFEQIRHVLTQLSGERKDVGAPARILAIGGKEVQAFRSPKREAGYEVSTASGDYIVLFLIGSRSRVVFHEYVHFFIERYRLRFPLWFNEGVAEVYSNIVPSANAVHVGEAIPVHLNTLRGGAWIDLPTLFTVTPHTAIYNESSRVGMLYAESWALAHMLLLSPEYQPGAKQFLAQMGTGVSTEEALRAAFGKSTDQVTEDLRAYVARPVLPSKTLVLPERMEKAEVTVTPLHPASAGLVLAEVLSAIKKRDEAERLFAELARQYPANAEVETGLGELAMETGKDDEAAVHLQRAIRLGSHSGRTYYDFAVLLRDDSSKRKEYRENLAKAAELDPLFFQAQYLLGYEHLREGEFAEAVRYLQHAVELAPTRAPVWEQLALAYRGAGKRDEAVTAAQMAVSRADTPASRERMEALVKDVQGAESHARVPLPAPSGVRPEGELHGWKSDASVEGDLVQVDCLGSVARLKVVSAGKNHFLLVRDPGAVLMKNSGAKAMEFSCGSGAARHIVVLYQKRADATYGTAGDVTEMDFK